MRRKQLLKVLLPILLLSVVGAAGESKLTAVKVAVQGTTTTVTIRAAGSFTHTEYRPTDSRLLVDLEGVSAAALDGKNESLDVPGVSAYRVTGYKGANGAEVTRVELTVAPNATVKFSDTEGGVLVRVLGVKAVAAAPPLPALKAAAPASQTIVDASDADEPAAETVAVKPLSAPVTASPALVSAKTVAAPVKGAPAVHVRNVGMQHAAGGMEIRINGSGPMKPETMKLENPDRLVIDLPNAMWDYAPRQITVNNPEVKSIRMALYEQKPPVTRVVIDLAEPRDFQVIPAGNAVWVKLHAPAMAANAKPASPQPVMMASADTPHLAPALATAPVQSSIPTDTPAQAKKKTGETNPAPTQPSLEKPAMPVAKQQTSAASSAPTKTVAAPAKAEDKAASATPAAKSAAPAKAAMQQADVKPTQPVKPLPQPAVAKSEEKAASARAVAKPVESSKPAVPKVAAMPVANPLAAKPEAKSASVAPVVKPAAPVTPMIKAEAKPAATQPAVTPEHLMAKAQPAPAVAAPTTSPRPNPVLVASAQPAPAAIPQDSSAAQTPASGAQSYVMVEPQYQPKKQAAEPDPQQRASDAATKFAGEKKEVALVSGRPPGAPLDAAPQQAQAAPSAPPHPEINQPVQAPPQVRPKYTGEPISVNLKDVDLKDFFRLIHEISGLNVVLDPNVRGSLTLVLDDVPWDQALDIVLKNNGLERELDGNVLRIATIDTLRKEAESRRAQQEAKALADPKITVTRFLSYAHSKDVVPIIKKFLSQRGEIISDDRTNGLIIQDIPGVFPEIDRLLTQLDRKTPEVEIEARVVAATRNFARDIGVQLGFGWGNRASAVGGPSAVGQSPNNLTYNAAPPYFTVPGFVPAPAGAPTIPQSLSIPLFSNLPAVGPTSGFNFVNAGSSYRVDAILTMAESKGLLKILSRPRVVTQNNIQAVVRQGVRIPVVTQGQLAGPSTTTYIDAFLRLTVTPQITIENTIFLNVDVENTQPDFSHSDNLGNPTLLTQQATTQVLVTDGGTIVIGGVIQTNNSVAIFQVPVLGDLPGLGNLFKRRSIQTNTQELFFFITPKIIQT